MSSYLLLLPLVIGQFFGGGARQPSSTQKVALYSKPSVVRIISFCSGTYETQPELGGIDRPLAVGGIGTGFFVNSEGYILTSAHVVSASQGGEDGCKQKLFDNLVNVLTNEEAEQVDSNRRDFIRAQSTLTEFEYYQHVLLANSKQNSAEARLFDIKEIGTTEPGTGKDIAVIKIQLSQTPVLEITDSNNVDLGDKITVIGYPASSDRLDEFGDDSLIQAGVFEGTISKTNAVLKDNTRVLELDVSVGYGSSGSPVLDAQGNVVGMVTFTVDQAVDQVLQGGATPFAIRSEGLSEYVSQAGVPNEKGNLDILYRDGLDFLWSGNFEGAETKFKSVQDLFPQHSEVEPLLKEVRSEMALKEGKERNYIPLLAGITGAGCLLGVMYWAVNRRSSNTEVPVVSSLPENNTQSIKRLPLDPQPFSQSATLNSPEVRQATVVEVNPDPYVELRNQSGQKYYLTLQKNIHKIGRDSEWSDIKNIPDDGWAVVSRRQVTLCQTGYTYQVYDGDKEAGRVSSNGLFVNGELVDDNGYVLKNGDCLIIGGDPRTQVFLTFYDPDL